MRENESIENKKGGFNLKQLKLLKLSKLACQWHWLLLVLITITFLMTPSKAIAKEQTVTNLTDLQKVIQVDLTNRETTFRLYYTGNSKQMVEELSTVFEQAKQTNDYLNTSLTSWGYKVSGTILKTTLDFTVTYLTTKAQEDFIDERVKTLVPTLISSDMSEVTKEKAIHNWLIKNVSYDYTLKQRSAYTALTTGKTVCTGYAMLMNKMLDQAGIKNYIITGHLSQTGSSIPNTEQENHVWNLVQINSQWYHVDVTNDWNNPDSNMFFNKGSAFMKEKGFTWNEKELIRPVESTRTFTEPSNEPVLAESPERSIDNPIVTKPSESNLPVTLSEGFIRVIGFLDNLVERASTIIQQLSLIIRDLLDTQSVSK